MTSKQGAVLQSTRKTWSVPNGCWVISNRSVFLNTWALYNRCVLREVTSWNGKETAADADTKLTLVFQLLKVLEGGNADVLGLDPRRAANSGSRLHQTTPRSLPLLFTSYEWQLHPSNTRMEAYRVSLYSFRSPILVLSLEWLSYKVWPFNSPTGHVMTITTKCFHSTCNNPFIGKNCSPLIGWANLYPVSPLSKKYPFS